MKLAIGQRHVQETTGPHVTQSRKAAKKEDAVATRAAMPFDESVKFASERIVPTTGRSGAPSWRNRHLRNAVVLPGGKLVASISVGGNVAVRTNNPRTAATKK